MRHPQISAAALLAAIVENCDDAIIAKSLEGRIISWNPGAERLFGYSGDEIIGQPITVLIPPDRWVEETEILRRLAAGDRIDHFETVRKRKDGRLLDVSLTISPIINERGEIIGVSKIARDITQRNALERELRRREQLLNEFFASASAGMAILDADLRYLRINETLAGINGISACDHIGKNVRTILPKLGAELEPILEKILRTRSAVLNIEFAGETPRDPGTTRHWAASYFPIVDDTETVDGIGAVVIDITERQQAQVALRESETRFRQLAETIDVVFWMTDPDKSQILYVSPAYEKIWGQPLGEFYSYPQAWLDAVHPADRDRTQIAAINKQVTGDYDETYRIVRPDGSTRWIRDRAFPIHDAEGRVYRIVGTAEDITERRQLESQFHQAQKMESLGTLAGGIAHDFNNILAAISGYTELARLHALDSDLLKYLRGIKEASTRATDLVRQILAFSRHDEPQRCVIHLDRAVAESVRLLRATLPSTIEISVNLRSRDTVVLADTTQVHQIVMNLGTNAWHAMGVGPGTLTISTDVIEIDCSGAQAMPGLRPGLFLRVSVRDTGKGMDREVMERIFEPFFTTKAPGEGTGLGLSVVHGIMRRHGGCVTVYSQPSKGAVFQLYFPVHAGPATPELNEHGEIHRGNGERVLFVDDEGPLARIGETMLAKLGYAAHGFTRVSDALSLLRADPNRYDLVITDLTMPAMTGIQLAEELQKLRTGLPVILMTGSTATIDSEGIRARGIRAVLAKPQTLESLAAAVKQALNK